MSPNSWKVRAGRPVALAFILLLAPAALAQDTTPSTPPPLGPPPFGSDSGTGGAISVSSNQAPVIKTIRAVQLAGKKFRIYGTVADETPATCGVVMSGAATGVVLCDSSGKFDGVFD